MATYSSKFYLFLVINILGVFFRIYNCQKFYEVFPIETCKLNILYA
jgi:hypothetical protein